MGPRTSACCSTTLKSVGNGRQIGRLRSRHTGAAAYILTRAVAGQLLSWQAPWTLPVDHMLFNPKQFRR